MGLLENALGNPRLMGMGYGEANFTPLGACLHPWGLQICFGLERAGTLTLLISRRCQSNGLWRNWRIMKLLSEDSGLPRSNQKLSLHRANPNLQVLSEVPPRSSKSTFLEAGQMALTIPGSLQMAVGDWTQIHVDFQVLFKSRKSWDSIIRTLGG